MKSYEIILFFIAFLSGCMTPQERISNYQQKCSEYGYSTGSNAMAHCIQKQDERSFRASQRLLECSTYAFGTSWRIDSIACI